MSRHPPRKRDFQDWARQPNWRLMLVECLLTPLPAAISNISPFASKRVASSHTRQERGRKVIQRILDVFDPPISSIAGFDVCKTSTWEEALLAPGCQINTGHMVRQY